MQSTAQSRILWLILLLHASIFTASSSSSSSSSHTSIDALRKENDRLRAWNKQLRSYIASSKSSLSPSLLEVSGMTKPAAAAEEDIAAANKKASAQAINNFCLSPAECQERLFACRRHSIEKCWQTDYAKAGAPPGNGDLDQDRLSEINNRVKQKLKEIGIDVDCVPSTSGVQESVVLGGAGSASAAKAGDKLLS